MSKFISLHTILNCNYTHYQLTPSIMIKNTIKTVLLFFAASIALLSFSSCEKSPITLAMHDPIYPTGSQTVTYTLTKATSGTINSANLYVTVSTINSSGTVTSAGTETLINSWSRPVGDLTFTTSGGYGNNKLVAYRFEVVTPDETKNFRVTFVTRPYPVTDMPAPVYAQGDPDDVFDLVFIPDTDITNMNNFYSNVRGAILESFFDEPKLRFWRRQYNFYINTQTGTATDYDRRNTDGVHQVPSNNANLSFAEGRVLFHQNDLRDYASGGLFSSEMQNRGTILHELGHAWFDLADEYNSGSHYQTDPFPNNWPSLSAAQTAGGEYGSCKSASDAVQMGTSGWYKLCVESCQMKATGLNRTTYDCPDQYRINYAILDNAIN